MVTEAQKRTAQAIVNIFETGTPRGDYGSVTLIQGDAGHLTYGRSQTTLGSGNLAVLIHEYCSAPGAALAPALSLFLARLNATDFSLDHDMQFRDLLKRAGTDPVMRSVQDAFFDRVYWEPALTLAANAGISSPLGVAVVYDSKVHGSWAKMRDRTIAAHGTVSAIGERPWVLAYLQERRAWMAAGAFALSEVCVFRMDELRAIADQGKWDLELALRVRSRLIDEEVIAVPKPAPVFRKAPSSGFMLQGSFGERGNFELVMPHPQGGLAQTTRLNDAPGLPWTPPARFGGSEAFQDATMVQSSFTLGANKGNLEVVASTARGLSFLWRGDRDPFEWNGPIALPPAVFDSVGGPPALIQGQSGARGDFEMVVPRAGGGFSHYWRNNSDPALPWARGADVGKTDGVYEAVALLESRFTKPGTLEVIARRRDGRLFQYWREPAAPFAWNGPFEVPLAGLAPGVTATGVPGLIQSRRGQPGDYDLVTPLSSGGLAHMARINADPANLVWSAPITFAQDAGSVDAVALIQSTFGSPEAGSLEVAAQAGNKLLHYWRSDQPPFEWSSPGTVVSDLAPAAPGRVQRGRASPAPSGPAETPPEPARRSRRRPTG